MTKDFRKVRMNSEQVMEIEQFSFAQSISFSEALQQILTAGLSYCVQASQDSGIMPEPYMDEHGIPWCTGGCHCWLAHGGRTCGQGEEIPGRKHVCLAAVRWMSKKIKQGTSQ